MDTPLARLFQACDPMKPATAAQYVDCHQVRGGHAFSSRFMGALRNAGSNGGYIRHLITGHVGGGKSSELVHLKDQLTATNGTSKPYVVVLMDATEFIEDYDATTNDVLLAIVSELAATVKRDAGMELRDGYFKRKLNELIRFLGREVDAEEVELPIWEAKAKIKLLKLDQTAREKVRGALIGEESTFLEELNLLFAEARTAVRKQGFTDIVLILDNLEKIRRVNGADEGMPSHVSLFISNASKFTGLDCSFVLTIPLSLFRTHPGALRTAYGHIPFSLPMIKVRTRDGHEYPDGIACLEELLKKRGATEGVLTKDAEALLIRYSGGHVRDLLGSLREAISLAGDGPVAIEHARAALGQIVSSLQPTTAQWDRLAALDRDPDRRLNPDDPICASLLEQLFVLEYINGGEDDQFLQHDETWYSVHPLLAGMRSFAGAKKRLEESSGRE